MVRANELLILQRHIEQYISYVNSGGLIITTDGLMSPFGYFSLDYKFMEGLAAANNYKILYSSYIITVGKTEHGSDLQFHLPFNRKILSCFDYKTLNTVNTYMVFKKQDDSDFNLPYASQYLSKMHGHQGFNRLYH